MPASSGGPAIAGDPLRLILAGRFPDPDGGAPLSSSVARVVIEDSLDGAEAELVRACGLGGKLAVVSDVDTEAALAGRVAAALASRCHVQRITLGRRPHADTATLGSLTAAIAPGTDGIVAVGSGTINDLCKLAALAIDRPQVVFASAPSMNGFTSVSASLVEAGVKRSVRARAPIGVFFDLAVCSAAPLPLIRAGLGDSLCRPTAQRDWYLQHLLWQRPYRRAPFALLAADEPALLAQADALVGGDLGAMRSLVRTLVLSGLGMTLCDGSFPASQGEHLLAHYMEMTGNHADSSPSLHGEQIGVATLAMARLQQHMLTASRPPALASTRLTESDLRARWGPDVGTALWQQIAVKHIDAAKADAVNHWLATRWDSLRDELLRFGPSADILRSVLHAAGAATEPGELGWRQDHFRNALRYAREIRDRFTFLDFAADAGLDLTLFED